MSADLERLAAEFERFQAKIRQAEVNLGPILNESSIGGDQNAADTHRNLDIQR